MHELGITQQILELATHHAHKANAARVTDLHLVIGALSNIIDDSVQFYWDIISQGTVCAGSILHFQHLPTQLRCLDCHQCYTLSDELTLCPHCQSAHVEIAAGQAFYLDRIQIAHPEPSQSVP